MANRYNTKTQILTSFYEYSIEGDYDGSGY
jgi:hypothetical protein